MSRAKRFVYDGYGLVLAVAAAAAYLWAARKEEWK